MAWPKFTIGIEEEYQIIHPETRELTSYIQEFLDMGRVVLRDQIKPEFLQSQIEVGSSICNNIQEVRAELVRLRSAVCEMADSKHLKVAAAGTHPFSKWTEQQVTAGERYTKHAQNMGVVARQMLVFGMHVHIGIDDEDLRIDVMNQSRYFLPHLLPSRRRLVPPETRDPCAIAFEGALVGLDLPQVAAQVGVALP